MRISNKIIIPITGLLLLFIALFVYVFIYLTNSYHNIQLLTTTVQNIYNLSSRIQILKQEADHSTLSYRFDKDDKYVRIIEKNQADIDMILAKISQLITSPEGRELLSYYEATVVDVRSIRYDLVDAIKSEDSQLIQDKFRTWEILKDNSGAALYDLSNYNLQELGRGATLYHNFIQSIIRTVVLMTLLTILLIIALYVYLTRSITEPVEQLSQAAERISQGYFDGDIAVSTNDELGNLAGSLSSMSVKLRDYYLHLQNEVRQREQELIRRRKFEEQKDDFISFASHELKTPLTSLKLFTHLLQKHAEKNKHTEYKKYLTKMQDQIGKLTDLIASLLDVTRLQAGKMPFSMGYFDIGKTLENSVEIAREISTVHTVIVKGKTEKPVYGDENRITQVIDNLLANAIKYSPRGGSVTVGIENKRKHVVVSVTDTGIGIEKKDQKKIFGRFYRVSGADEKTFPGLGIGLYISAEIVKRHGGKIWVESKKNSGATFYFSVPYAPPDTANGQADEPPISVFANVN